MKRRIAVVIIVLLLIAIAVHEILIHSKTGGRVLTVSGRVEADETELSVRIPGRLTKVLIEDGVKVSKGDTIAIVEDEELKSKRREMGERIEEAKENIHAAESTLVYTTNNVRHEIEEAQKSLSIAGARLRQADAKRENAEKELARYSRLREREAISEERLDNSKLAYDVATEEVNTCREEVGRAKISLSMAEDSKELVRAKEKELFALRRARDQLQEALDQADINIGYAKVVAPISGVILRRVAEPGEVLPLGGTVGVMINPADIYVRTYVPERDIGMLRMGMRAEIVGDAYPRQPVYGFVCYISDRAEFTPKEIQSYEERVKQVFAVKICFSERAGTVPGGNTYYEILKKGMPVDVRFNLNK